jgi:hypothetical protein
MEGGREGEREREREEERGREETHTDFLARSAGQRRNTRRFPRCSQSFIWRHTREGVSRRAGCRRNLPRCTCTEFGRFRQTFGPGFAQCVGCARGITCLTQVCDDEYALGAPWVAGRVERGVLERATAREFHDEVGLPARAGGGGWVGCGCVGARRYAWVRVGARGGCGGCGGCGVHGGAGVGARTRWLRSGVLPVRGHRVWSLSPPPPPPPPPPTPPPPPPPPSVEPNCPYIYTEVIRARCDHRRRSCAGRASGVEGGRHPAVPTAFRDHGGPPALARPCPPRPPVLYIRIEHSNTVFRTRWLPETSRRGSE